MASVAPARYVPYGFARSFNVLVAAQSGDAIEVWVSPRTPVSALTELSRVLPHRLVTVRKEDAELAAAISDIGMRFPSGTELNQWETTGVRHVKNGRTHQDLPQYFSLYEDFKQHERELNIQKAIQNLSIPITIHHGGQDTSVPITEGESLARWANVELHVIPSADHVFGASHPWTSSNLPKELAVLCEQTLLGMK